MRALAWGVSLLVLIVTTQFFPCKADIYLFVEGDIKGPIENTEATFGPPIGPMGVLGSLQIANPSDACSPLIPPANMQYGAWIALISREQNGGKSCTFDQKINNAALAGASAAIVFDDQPESLVIMGKPNDHPDPPIPSVFISQHSGFVLLQILSYEKGQDLIIRIMPNQTGFDWFTALIAMLFTVLTAGSVLLLCFLLRLISDRVNPDAPPTAATVAERVQEPPGLPSSVLLKLPIVIFQSPKKRAAAQCDDEEESHKEPLLTNSYHPDSPAKEADDSLSDGSSEGWLPGVHAGETKRCCAICLEDYGEGEKLRRLPCNHLFHTTCVDQWFGGRKVCPVCRYPASSPSLRPAAEVSEEEDSQRWTTWLPSLAVTSWLSASLFSPASQPPAATAGGGEIAAPLLALAQDEERAVLQPERGGTSSTASVSAPLPPLSVAARMRAARRGRRRGRAIFAPSEAEDEEVDLEAGSLATVEAVEQEIV